MKVVTRSNGAWLPRWEPQLVVGLALVGVFWPAAWSHLGALGEFAFFPLWLGYILTVDGLVALRGGRSLLRRAPGHVLGLFALSAPLWWLFEGINDFTLTWHYLGAEKYSVGQILALATINFATVLPAVLESAELVATFKWVKKPPRQMMRAGPPRWLLWAAMFVGAGSLLGLVLFPRVFFPATWLWAFLLADPLNLLRGRPSLIEQVWRGDLRRLAALSLGALVCGFFWEMWNFFSFPKWYYTVPLFGFGKVFEMPILGYLGYVPFAWELYALYQLIWGFFRLGPTWGLSLALDSDE